MSRSNRSRRSASTMVSAMSTPKSAWIRMSSSSSSIPWSSCFLVKTALIPAVSWSDERLRPDASRWNQLCFGCGVGAVPPARRHGLDVVDGRLGRTGGGSVSRRASAARLGGGFGAQQAVEQARLRLASSASLDRRRRRAGLARRRTAGRAGSASCSAIRLPSSALRRRGPVGVTPVDRAPARSRPATAGQAAPARTVPCAPCPHFSTSTLSIAPMPLSRNALRTAARRASRSRLARSRATPPSTCGIRAAGVPGRGEYGNTWR